MVSVVYWTSDQRHCEQQNSNISNANDNEEINCDITKITSSKYEKANFDTEIAKQQEQLKNCTLSVRSFFVVQ